MRTDKLESAEDVINRLFDPRYSFKRAIITKEVKYAYLQHFLELHWSEIVGQNLSCSCSIEKIDGNEIYIRTKNSMLANELYMMKNLFLQKINSFLLGRIIIKKVYFHTGSLKYSKNKIEDKELPVIEYIKCPNCGARMEKGMRICSVCEREQRNQLRSKIAELLRIQPWLKYNDCIAYYKCDKILFTAVKDDLKNYYFEKVRHGFADKKESLLAVLFLTEKHPEELTSDLYERVLAYLRRDQSVSAFGSRLYGKE